MLLTVNQVGSQLAGILDLDSLLATVVELMRTSFDYPHVLLYLLEDGDLVLRAAAGPMADELLIGAPHLPLDGNNVAASAARTGQIMAPTESHGLLHPFLAEIRSGAAAPIRSGGSVSGVLEIVSPTELAFTANDGLVLQTLANMVGVAAQNSRLYRRMEELAMVDDLTGLLNRRTLVARLSAEWDRCQRFKHRLGLVVVDVDHFKRVNDNYGHPSGDIALAALGQLIAGAIRRVDSAGRLGGDEFLLILPETGQAGALEVARRMGLAGQSLLIADHEKRPISVTLSLGVASWPDTPATAAADLLQAADQALYRAKAAGRNCSSL
jgi:diguanylate cyclase (GGDEF)-like protein